MKLISPTWYVLQMGRNVVHFMRRRHVSFHFAGRGLKPSAAATNTATTITVSVDALVGIFRFDTIVIFFRRGRAEIRGSVCDGRDQIRNTGLATDDDFTRLLLLLLLLKVVIIVVVIHDGLLTEGCHGRILKDETN